MSQALLLIDLQNDYFPGGALELAGATQAGERAGELLSAFRGKGLPVFHVQHLANRPGATFLLPGTPGALIHRSVAPRAGEAVIEKHFPNAFRDTGLLEELRTRGITQLAVAGMMTHMCVDTTVRAAFDLGFACDLASDGCATRTLGLGGVAIPAEQVQAAFLAALHGLFAQVRTVAEIIAGI